MVEGVEVSVTMTMRDDNSTQTCSRPFVRLDRLVSPPRSASLLKSAPSACFDR